MIERHVTRLTPLPFAVAAAVWLGVALAPAAAAGPTWFNSAWPYRARIDCPAGPGDVAYAHVMLGGRTTPDGRDIRITNLSGTPQVFRILHHDPAFMSLIKIKVTPDQATSVWLYFGNLGATPLYDPNIEPAQALQAVAQWRRDQLARAKAVRLRDAAVLRLGQMQGGLGQAKARDQVSPEEVERISQRIAALRQVIDEIYVPPATPRPKVRKVWEPRRGLLLRVYRKARQFHPRPLIEVRRLIEDSTPEGIDFRANIADAFNPFGESDHYLSEYDGYLRIDRAGEYQFCSSSDAGSWIVVEDRPILAWPGPHSAEGSQRGEKSGRIKLEPGAAHVRYYHEEGTGGQLAFVGWKPPGAEHFSAIPDDQWVPVRKAKVVAYEGHGKPFIATPQVRVVNTHWLRDSQDRQASLVQLSDPTVPADDTTHKLHWTFGDGLEQTGNNLQHVFFRTFRPEVSLTVSDSRGRSDTVTVSPPIFYVNVDTGHFPAGAPEQYVEAAAEYDVERLQQPDLIGAAWFWFHLEQWPQFIAATRALARRFGVDAATVALARRAAEALLRPDAYDPKVAQGLLETAERQAPTGDVRRELMLLRARLLGWHLDQPAQAEALYEELRAHAPEGSDLERACVAGLGDAALLRGRYERAHRQYEQVRDLAGDAADQPEELAKAGGYPFSVEDLLARGEYDWAFKTLDQWEAQFPTQKLQGYSFFLRGKVAFVAHPSDLALRCFELAEAVAPTAVHVPETVWLRANCLLALGRYDQALQAFTRIRHDYTETEFFHRAADKIKHCREKLAEDAAPPQNTP